MRSRASPNFEKEWINQLKGKSKRNDDRQRRSRKDGELGMIATSSSRSPGSFALTGKKAETNSRTVLLPTGAAHLGKGSQVRTNYSLRGDVLLCRSQNCIGSKGQAPTLRGVKVVIPSQEPRNILGPIGRSGRLVCYEYLGLGDEERVGCRYQAHRNSSYKDLQYIHG